MEQQRGWVQETQAHTDAIDKKGGACEMRADEKMRPSRPAQTKPKPQQDGAGDRDYQKNKITAVDSS